MSDALNLPDGWTAERAGSWFTVSDADGAVVGKWNGREAAEAGAAEAEGSRHAAPEPEATPETPADPAPAAPAPGWAPTGSTAGSSSSESPTPEARAAQAVYTDGHGIEHRARVVVTDSNKRARLTYTSPTGNLQTVTADHSRKPRPGTYRNL